MKILIPFILLLSFTACGPAGKLKRAEKLIAKAELQGAVWHVDTVRVEVPVYIRKIERDTIFFPTLHDTVTLQHEKLVIKYVKLRGDSVYIYGACEADTIYQTVTHTVTKTIKAKGGIKWWWIAVAFVGGVVLGRIILKLLL